MSTVSYSLPTKAFLTILSLQNLISPALWSHPGGDFRAEFLNHLGTGLPENFCLEDEATGDYVLVADLIERPPGPIHENITAFRREFFTQLSGEASVHGEIVEQKEIVCHVAKANKVALCADATVESAHLVQSSHQQIEQLEVRLALSLANSPSYQILDCLSQGLLLTKMAFCVYMTSETRSRDRLQVFTRESFGIGCSSAGSALGIFVGKGAGAWIGMIIGGPGLSLICATFGAGVGGIAGSSCSPRLIR